MMPLYERVRLVDFSDRRYRQLRARFASHRRGPVGSGPTSRDLFSKDAERTLRRFIASQLRLTPLRIIRYHERAGFLTVEKYRELDGVALAGGRVILIEIKTTKNRTAVREGIAQLDMAREILAASFPEITTLLLVVDTDDTANSEVATYLSLARGLRIIGSLDEISDDRRTHVMPFSVADIEALSRMPVHLDWRSAA
jgi:hypothetical protein